MKLNTSRQKKGEDSDNQILNKYKGSTFYVNAHIWKQITYDISQVN